MEPLQVAEEVVESSPNKLQDIYRLLAEGSFPSSFCSIKKKNLKRYARKFILEGGCLYYIGPKKEEKREVVVDPQRRHHIFLESHLTESGHHLGQKKTVNRIQSKYYWLGVVKDVIDWIKVCETCQNAEYHKYPCTKVKSVKVAYPWEYLGLTFHGPFPPSSQNCTYVILLTDLFTKWAEALAVPRNDAACTAKVLASTYYRFGASKAIYCNQSWDFCEEVSRMLGERWNISQTLTAADSSEQTGLDDQSYDVLKSSIRQSVTDHPKDWDGYLESVLYEFRTMVNPVTKYTPFFLMYNRNPHPFSTSSDAVDEASEHVAVFPSNEDLAQFSSTDQLQRETVRQMVLSNFSDAERPVKRAGQRCRRSPLAVAFQGQQEMFESVTEQSLKRLKPSRAISFKFETVLSADGSVTVGDKDSLTMH